MTFFAFGINHETAAVAAREAFALQGEAQLSLYDAVALSPGAEWMLLSTCNRTEVYLFGAEADVHTIQKALAEQAGRAWPEADSFRLRDEEAVLHVLEVTSGLRSLVLGDAQIFCQVKDAYRVAVEVGAVDTIMHRLLHTAFRSAKRVVNETDLTSGAASVPTAALQAARRHYEKAASPARLEDQRVLVVGAGQMARLLISVLKSTGAAHLVVTNRSHDRACRLAGGHGADVVPWAERHAAVAEADLVLVASGAHVPVLLASELPAPEPGAPSKLVVDIAVPRNVDPAVDGLPGYHVIDLDRLQQGVEGAEERRSAAVPAARMVCRQELDDYRAWFCHHQAMQPAIHRIRATFDAIRQQEIDRHHHRFSEADRAELDRLTESILQKLLAIPVVQLKSMNPESLDYERGIRLLHALFSRENCEGVEAHATPAAEATPPRATSLCL